MRTNLVWLGLVFVLSGCQATPKADQQPFGEGLTRPEPYFAKCELRENLPALDCDGVTFVIVADSDFRLRGDEPLLQEVFGGPLKIRALHDISDEVSEPIARAHHYAFEFEDGRAGSLWMVDSEDLTGSHILCGESARKESRCRALGPMMAKPERLMSTGLLNAAVAYYQEPSTEPPPENFSVSPAIRLGESETATEPDLGSTFVAFDGNNPTHWCTQDGETFRCKPYFSNTTKLQDVGEDWFEYGIRATMSANQDELIEVPKGGILTDDPVLRIVNREVWFNREMIGKLGERDTEVRLSAELNGEDDSPVTMVWDESLSKKERNKLEYGFTSRFVRYAYISSREAVSMACTQDLEPTCQVARDGKNRFLNRISYQFKRANRLRQIFANNTCGTTRDKLLEDFRELPGVQKCLLEGQANGASIPDRLYLQGVLGDGLALNDVDGEGLTPEVEECLYLSLKLDGKWCGACSFDARIHVSMEDSIKAELRRFSSKSDPASTARCGN